MNCLNNDTLQIIYRFKHNMAYIDVLQNILKHKNKIMFDAVILQMSDIVKTNLLFHSIYNPRFGQTCLICDTTKKRHKKTLCCSNSRVFQSMITAKYKNGIFYYS